MTLEHAIQLHMRLPWFTVAYYGSADLALLQKHFPKERYPNLDLNRYRQTTRDLERIRGAFAKGTLRYVISTKVFRQGVSFNHLKVLIRADGDTSEVAGIQIPGRLARLDENKKFAYLVDIADNFNPWAMRRAAARKATYEKQQWQEITRKEIFDDHRVGTACGSREAAGELDPGELSVCGTCVEPVVSGGVQRAEADSLRIPDVPDGEVWASCSLSECH